MITAILNSPSQEERIALILEGLANGYCDLIYEEGAAVLVHNGGKSHTALLAEDVRYILEHNLITPVN